MPVTIEVRRQYPWALLPEKRHWDRSSERHVATLYAEHFRYTRRVRSAAECPPWVLGRELGWVIASPIDVTMDCVDDAQFAAESSDEVAEVGRMLRRPELWRRGDGWLATSSDGWLRFTQFRGSSGTWESMFMPNGDGTVEWRLGWAARIPDAMFLLITSVEDGPLAVPAGVMTAKQVNRTASSGGMSLAVQPLGRTEVKRGAPIARMVLLHPDALQASCVEVDA